MRVVAVHAETHNTHSGSLSERMDLMSLNQIVNAWRDAEYYENLDAETRALLPENPAGEIELTDTELANIDGGTILLTVTLISPVTITLF